MMFLEVYFSDGILEMLIDNINIESIFHVSVIVSYEVLCILSIGTL